MTSNRTLRIGFIGCGHIANKKHLQALSKIDGVELVAFCDIIPKRAEDCAKRFGTPDAKIYSDYKELLKDESIDAVHVCTPNRSHSFITVDALEAGKHVMCEKPMAINSEEAQKMLDAAKRTGKKLTVAYQNRNTPEALFLKDEADKGTFGEIYYAKATALRRRGVPTRGVFLNEYEQGGGPLIDIGTHALDLTLWIMDNYKPKYCVGTAYHKLNNQTNTANSRGVWDPEKFTVEDSAFGFVVMENGATIIIESAWAINMLDTREATTTVCGTLAGGDMIDGVRINSVVNNRQCVTTANLDVGGISFNDGATDLTPGDIEARRWIEAIRNDTEPFVLPEQAFTVTRILEGIYESARTGTVYNF